MYNCDSNIWITLENLYYKPLFQERKLVSLK